MDNEFNNDIKSEETNTNGTVLESENIFLNQPREHFDNVEPIASNQTGQPKKNKLIMIIVIVIIAIIGLFIVIKMLGGKKGSEPVPEDGEVTENSASSAKTNNGKHKSTVYDAAGDTIDSTPYKLGEIVKISDKFSLKITGPKKVEDKYYKEHNITMSYYEYTLEVTNNDNTSLSFILHDSNKNVLSCVINSKSVANKEGVESIYVSGEKVTSGTYYIACLESDKKEFKGASSLMINSCPGGKSPCYSFYVAD